MREHPSLRVRVCMHVGVGVGVRVDVRYVRAHPCVIACVPPLHPLSSTSRRPASATRRNSSCQGHMDTTNKHGCEFPCTSSPVTCVPLVHPVSLITLHDTHLLHLLPL